MSTYNFVLNQLYSQLYKIGFRVRVPQNTGSTTDTTLFSQGNKSPYEQISMSDLALILCWMLFLIQLCHLSGFWGLTSL